MLIKNKTITSLKLKVDTRDCISATVLFLLFIAEDEFFCSTVSIFEQVNFFHLLIQNIHLSCSKVFK